MLTSYVDTASILLTEPAQTASVTVNNIAPIGPGTHYVDASYAGDSNYSPAVSGTVALTAGLAPLVITPASGTYSYRRQSRSASPSLVPRFITRPTESSLPVAMYNTQRPSRFQLQVRNLSRRTPLRPVTIKPTTSLFLTPSATFLCLLSL